MTKTPNPKSTACTEHRGAPLIRRTAARVVVCLALTCGLFGFATTDASAQPVELRGSVEPITDAGQGAVVHNILPLIKMVKRCTTDMWPPPAPDYCSSESDVEIDGADTLTR